MKKKEEKEIYILAADKNPIKKIIQFEHSCMIFISRDCEII